MADYIDLEKYCATICRCDKNYCSKTSCSILRAKAEDVAPVVHGKRIKTKQHRWKTYPDGEIDMFAWSNGFCGGPQCIDCGAHFCVDCVEQHEGTDSVNERLKYHTCRTKTICSICGRTVPDDAPYCNCGAKMDLEE